ncbi:MAG: Na/Pi cotransporter family protein [Deltaproteobacteria bacterium]|nr:Na/Pi cotransporter family protein [Deltaproteobacteria bacterium]
MNITNVIIQTLGGLGLFILGMNMMTEGLQMSAGNRIKKVLSAISSNRIIGCATGAGVTAVIQSSSATTVMLIGFVGAGMMTLQQAVGVVLGVNMGTTVTAQLIAFKLTKAALPAIAIGVSMKFFSKKRKFRYIGEIILGFGLLFYGMTIMKHGLSPIKSDPAFISFFTHFDASGLGGILLCVAMGAILTIMVQSSSATVGLTMALATQGLLTFPGAMALVLGENIGTTITAEIATIGSTNINAHRTARAHTLFNVIGVGIMVALFPFFVKIIEFITLQMGAGSVNEVVKGDMINISRYIANGHTMFNVINAMIFLIFLPWLIKAAIFLSPKEEEAEDCFRLPHFDNTFMDSPVAALAQVHGEIIRMGEMAQAELKNTVNCINNRNLKKLGKWKRYEDFLDTMQKELLSYLTTISQGGVNEYEAQEISALMRMTNNMERIGDSIESIAKFVENRIENNIKFSGIALSDLNKIANEVMKFLEFVTFGMQGKNKEFMEIAHSMENRIDAMREQMRTGHVDRLRSGDCSVEPGLIFMGMLSNFEKIGDYCLNIAQAIASNK